MYGGFMSPGVLESDTATRRLYESQGYAEVGRTLLFTLDLGTFRAPIDRQQMQHRRKMAVELKADPPARNWWEACTTSDFQLLGSMSCHAAAARRCVGRSVRDPGGGCPVNRWATGCAVEQARCQGSARSPG